METKCFFETNTVAQCIRRVHPGNAENFPPDVQIGSGQICINLPRNILTKKKNQPWERLPVDDDPRNYYN